MATYNHCSKKSVIGSACSILTIALTAMSCSTSNPLQPSIGAAILLQPSDGAQVPNANQPVMLVAQNATLSGSGIPTYTFEVATDAAFTGNGKVQVKDAVPQGNGQTSAILEILPPDKDYYWHVRAQTAGKTGVFSATFKFTIGGVVLISTPGVIAPVNGAETAIRPTLSVTNAGRQGPSGTIVYVFDIATSPSFSAPLTWTVNEGQGRTSFTPSVDLIPSQLYYWRVTAVDQTNNVPSSPSPTQTFTTGAKTQQGDLAAQLGMTLWPNAYPTGTNGRAVLGDNWQVQTLFYVPGGVSFQSPRIEWLRFFDLFDRGYDPQGAVDWMNSHGYPTAAQWYPPPEKAVLGLQYVYLGARYKVVGPGAIWDVVLKAE